MAKGPVLIDLSDQDMGPADVAAAPPVPDLGAAFASDGPDAHAPQGQAMRGAIAFGARRPSWWARLFWGVTAALLSAVVSVAAWDCANSLIARVPVLGWAIVGLLTVFVLILCAIAVRELAALGRLSKIDGLRRAADEAVETQDLAQARSVTARLLRLYKGREDTRWGRDRFAELQGDQLDAASLLAVAEVEILGPLDAQAQRHIESAARQVATVTALVPLALADVATALAANLRMIRAIAEVYGGRSGVLGNWRLTRAVLTHLVATGAVAVGDDMLEPILGGSILGKLSRRFGEGLVNGGLTARVGIAAMDVCRPLPFARAPRPKIRTVVTRALGGLFASS